MMRYTLLVAAFAASIATPALAQQANATANAKGTVLQALTLVNKSDLDFGTVAPDFSNPDVVSIDANSGARTIANGFVVGLPGLYTRAQFDGNGTPGKTVAVSLGQPAGGVVTSGGNVVAAVLKLDSASAAGPLVIPAGGVFSTYVGGDFTIGANQPSGVYTAQFTVTAVYQ